MASEVVLKIAPVFDGLEDQQELVLDHVTDGSDEEQDSEGESKHENLLKEIVSLSSKEQRKRKASKQRSEPNQAVSEFNLSAITDTEQQVGLHDLIRSLQKSSEHGILKKKLDSMQRNSGTLETPLPKPEMQKIQRIIAYEETSKDVEKWAPTVKKNREAEHLTFPLKPNEPPKPSLKSLAVNFKPRTPLEEEVAAVLKGSSHVLERNNKELTEAEEEALLAMDLEEAKERRHELQKLRALQSYYEAKCHRIRKIKSKKYHRIKRKAEKRAAEKSSTENVQNEDPAFAKEVLEKADRLRATERVSLKHRNTSKWAKQLIAKGGKNPETRRLLQDQLRISRLLTQKTEESSTDEEMEGPDQKEVIQDDEKQSHAYGNLLTSEDNPWRIETSKKGNSQETPSSFEHGNCKEGAITDDSENSSTKLHRLHPIISKETAEVDVGESEMAGDDDVESEEEFKLQPVKTVDENRKKKRLKKKDKVTKGTEKKIKRKSELVTDNGDIGSVKKVKISKKTSERNSKKVPKESHGTGTSQNAVEGKQFDSIKKRGGNIDKKRHKIIPDDSVKNMVNDIRHLNDQEEKDAREGENSESGANEKNRDVMRNTKSRDICVDPKKIFQIEDNEAKFDDAASNSLQQKRIDIQQAFANDDVAEEFVREKDETVEASKPKDVDLSLPGWGCWAGAGVKPSNKKKTAFIKKAVSAPPRKDRGLSHVIINEEKSKWLAKNQVSSIPHPFNSHVQFERSMRNPVGKHWNTSTVVTQLTKPRVSTLIGTIIEPIKATKEIKQKKPRKEKKKGKASSGITIHS